MQKTANDVSSMDCSSDCCSSVLWSPGGAGFSFRRIGGGADPPLVERDRHRGLCDCRPVCVEIPVEGTQTTSARLARRTGKRSAHDPCDEDAAVVSEDRKSTRLNSSH